MGRQSKCGASCPWHRQYIRGFYFTNKKMMLSMLSFRWMFSKFNTAYILQIAANKTKPFIITSFWVVHYFHILLFAKKSARINCQPKWVVIFVLSYKCIEKVISVSAYIPWPIYQIPYKQPLCLTSVTSETFFQMCSWGKLFWKYAAKTHAEVWFQ